MFCIKCGGPATVGNFCSEHFLEAQKLFEIKDFSYIYCNQCGIDEKDLRGKISRSIKTSHKITREKISLRTLGNRVYATIEAEGVIKGLKKTETHKSLVMLRQKMCEMHVRLSGGYYEAMIQIRGPQKDSILKKVKQVVPEKAISSIEEIKEGYDVKIMRKPNAAAAAKALRERFSVKESYKVGGSKKGQMVYRNYYAVR